MDDDFNTGGAIGELFEMIHALNRFAHAQAGGTLDDYRAGMTALKELTQILGLFGARPAKPAIHEDRLTAPLLDLLVSLRTQVRKAKNFALADEIRAKLTELGVTLEDRPDGTAWKIDR